MLSSSRREQHVLLDGSLRAFGDLASRCEPYVAATLHQISQEFGCPSVWKGHKDFDFELQTAPLPSALHRSGPSGPMDTYVKAVATHSEHVWYVEPEQIAAGSRKGKISLNASLALRLELEGCESRLFPGEQGKPTPGMVAAATDWRLSDGTCCLRLETVDGGTLWLRPQPPSQLQEKELIDLVKTPNPMSIIDGRVVLLSFSGSSFDVPQPPWRTLKANDTTGRIWTVEECTLGFRALLTPPFENAKGRFSQSHPVIVRPPYEAVWSPPSEQGACEYFAFPLC